MDKEINPSVRYNNNKHICTKHWCIQFHKTNASILWKTVHTKGRSHMRGEESSKEAKKVNIVGVLAIQEWTENF
jgi:hypothetical protein